MFLAAVPVLALWVHNLPEGVTLGDALVPLAVVVGATVAVGVVASLALRDALRGGLVASSLVFVVFAFGPVSRAVGASAGAGSWIVLIVSLLAFATLIVLIARARRPRLLGATKTLNVIAVGLVLFNVASIGWYHVRSRGQTVRTSGVLRSARTGVAPFGRPDVFYIMLDDYGGAKAMKDLLGYDNSAFLDALRRRGFVVPAHTTTNYARTTFSLASTMNLQYIDRLVPPGRVLGEATLRPLLDHDAVPAFLKAQGYRYVHIGSWVKDTAKNPQADVNVTLGHGLSEFSNALLQQTALEPALQRFGTLDWDRQQYERALFQFDQTAKARDLHGPTFVFTHILVPHWPYVFDEHGRFADSRVSVADIKRPLDQVTEATRQRYVRQLAFANARTLRLIDALLAGPPAQRPVIVLQSDEGFFTWLETGANPSDQDLQQHFDILNAYYLPRLRRTGLYPTITPVNTFRLLFDDYFRAGLPLLPDRNFALAGQRGGYRFVDVTSRVRALV